MKRFYLTLICLAGLLAGFALWFVFQKEPIDADLQGLMQSNAGVITTLNQTAHFSGAITNSRFYFKTFTLVKRFDGELTIGSQKYHVSNLVDAGASTHDLFIGGDMTQNGKIRKNVILHVSADFKSFSLTDGKVTIVGPARTETEFNSLFKAL